ncbi:MAG: Gfo/Idh/MocA family oxidoreductase [Bryobacteraceae bacterium]|jgi:predicted dehydrogenase
MDSSTHTSSRRSFLTGSAAAAAAFTIVEPELVRGWGSEKLKIGLIGCGNRGTEAIYNTMVGAPHTELVAMADIFEDHLEGSLKTLKNRPEMQRYQDRINVSPEMRFVGFDAYKKLIGSGVDIVFLATPPAWRPIHFEAAIEANKHVFCEKPFGTDPVHVRRFMAAAKKSEEKKLTVVSGAQRRSDPFYLDMIAKVHSGELGDVLALYAYWLDGPVIQNPNGRKEGWGDFEWQHRNWYSNLWLCGDQIVEQHLHNIDVCNWIMSTHPVKCWASGGAAWRPKGTEIYGNIYDHVSADFEYENGVHMSSYCRQYPHSFNRVNEDVLTSKKRMTWNQTHGGPGYPNEHGKLLKSIRGDGPYVNEGMAVAESTMTCIMGREAAYSGQLLTWDMMMNSQLDLFPKGDYDYDMKWPATPFPVPGEYKFI